MQLFTIISASFLLLGCISAGGCSSCLGALEDAAINNNEALEHAARNGRLDIVKHLLSLEGVDPAANNNHAIRWSSRNGHLDIVKHLLSLDGVDPTASNNEAIRWAAANGHLDVVKELLSLPAVDPTDMNNFAIRWASENGHLEVVKYLLSLDGVDPTASNNHAIRWASRNGHFDIVKLLLSIEHVDPTAFNNHAIRLASANGRLKVVKELLSWPGIDPSVLKSQALKSAVRFNHLEIVKLLLEDGRVDPTINNLALFLEAKEKIHNPSLKKADSNRYSELVSLLQHDEMVSSILFLQGQQKLTPTRFLDIINFERAWIQDSYIESVFRFPQVTELLSGILGIDRAAARKITTLKRLNEEMVQLMKSLDEEMNYHRKHTEFPKYLDLVKNNQELGRKLDMDDQKPLSYNQELGRKLDMDDQKPLSLVYRKRWDFLWRYFGALREYSEDKIALRKKLGFLQRKTNTENGKDLVPASPSGENLDSVHKKAKDEEVPGDNASRFNYLTVWKLQNMIALPVSSSKS